MKTVKFEKWQGLGNDFIILTEEKATPELAKIMCDRNFGIYRNATRIETN